MMTSTKISLWAFGIWFIASLLATAMVPSESEFMSMGFGEAQETIQSVNAVQSIANIAFIVGLISLIVTGFKKVMGKHTPHITNIGGHNISAGGNSTVATDSAKIDQSINISDSQIQSVSEHRDTIEKLVNHIIDSDLPDVTKSHAKLLSESIGNELGSKSPNKEKIQGYIKDVVSLVEATRPTAELVLSGIKMLKSLF